MGQATAKDEARAGLALIHWLPVLITSPTPVVIVHVASSGPNWLVFALAQLGSFLVGTATALVIQIWVVPRVETRKRREDRWERDVRELADLLATRLTSLSNDAHGSQYVFRHVHDQADDKYDQAVVEQQAKDARDATWAYSSLIRTQVALLMGRVTRINAEHDELKRLKRLGRDYELRAILARDLADDDRRTDAEFGKAWAKERDTREALIRQVQAVESLPHPPSAPRKLPWSSRRAKP